MNHFKWLGQAATIMEIQRYLHNNMQTCEITLLGKGHPVKAHRFVLSACSNFLRNLLADLPKDCECTISIPDVSANILDNVILFIYLGEVNITSNELSEFLQTINILGIKSAISFECNVSSISSVMGISNENSVITINAVDTLSTVMTPSLTEREPGAIASEELIIKDDGINGKSSIHTIEDNVAINSETRLITTTRDMDFLQFYQEAPTEKITYSIEKGPTCAINALEANECILAENTSQFGLATCTKLSEIPNVEQVNMDIHEDDVVDSGHMIEEYGNSEDRLIQINAPNENNIISEQIIPNNSSNSFTILKNNQKNETIFVTPLADKNCIDNVNDCFNDQNRDFDLDKRREQSPTDLAYQSIINEGLTLPKAASKYKVSKTLLWRKVRNAGVRKYVEASKAQPAKEESNTAIDDACKAVVMEGLSLQKAAVKFDVSKTVLWRRVSKHPDYMKIPRENPVVSKACERLKTGESLKSISKDLDIPMSTLHRYKVRLLLNGDLPDFVSCRRRDKFAKMNFQKNLEKAVHACIYKGISQNHAAHLYAISKSTLWRHLQKRVAEAEAAEAAGRAAAADSDNAQESTDEEEFEDEILMA